MRTIRGTIGIACVVSGAMLGGCLATGSATVRSSGQYVSQETLSLIDAGTSTERELLDLLGPPTRTMHHHDGRTVHVYQYTLDAEGVGSVLLLVWGSGHERVERTTFFEVRDGVVTRYWTDVDDEEAGELARDLDDICRDPDGA